LANGESNTKQHNETSNFFTKKTLHEMGIGFHGPNQTHKHYYILCPFAKGQTKNLKVLRKKNKKPEGFAKEKQSAKFAMQNASQLVAHHSTQI
jgi:hypothetical protein